MGLVKVRGFYHLRRWEGGRQIQSSLKTKDKAEARRLAALIVKAEASDRRAELQGALDRVTAGGSSPTLGAVVDWYCSRDPALLGFKVRTTPANNVGALRSIMRQLGQDDRWRELTAADLTRDLVDRYAARMLATAGKDEADRARAAATILSNLAQARSIFSADAVAAMARDGLHVGDMSGFKAGRPVKAPPLRDKILPAGEIDVWKARFESVRESDRHIYAAFLLCFGLALRAGEATAARWTWCHYDESRRAGLLTVRDRPDEGFSMKGARPRSIPFGPRWWSAAQATRTESPYILPGSSATAREHLAGVRLADWMRARGWKGPKFAHELRAWRGQEWWSDCSPQECQKWLGHASITTTERHYAGLIDGRFARSVDI